MELKPFDPKGDVQKQLEETREYRQKLEEAPGCGTYIFYGILVLLTLMLFSLRSGCVYD